MFFVVVLRRPVFMDLTDGLVQMGGTSIVDLASMASFTVYY